MNNKEEWKKLLEKYESQEIQQRLDGIFDELQHKEHRRIVEQFRDLREHEQGQIGYGYMCPMVLGIGSVCYSNVYPYGNLTRFLYFQRVTELYHEIARYPNFYERQNIWFDVLKSMPEGFQDFYFDEITWGDPEFYQLTPKQVNDFLEYLKTEQFYQDMRKLRIAEQSYGKASQS